MLNRKLKQTKAKCFAQRRSNSVELFTLRVTGIISVYTFKCVLISYLTNLITICLIRISTNNNIFKPVPIFQWNSSWFEIPQKFLRECQATFGCIRPINNTKPQINILSQHWDPWEWTIHAPKYFQLIIREDDGPGRLATDSTNARENRPTHRGMRRGKHIKLT